MILEFSRHEKDKDLVNKIKRALVSIKSYIPEKVPKDYNPILGAFGTIMLDPNYIFKHTDDEYKLAKATEEEAVEEFYVDIARQPEFYAIDWILNNQCVIYFVNLKSKTYESYLITDLNFLLTSIFDIPDLNKFLLDAISYVKKINKKPIHKFINRMFNQLCVKQIIPTNTTINFLQKVL